MSDKLASVLDVSCALGLGIACAMLPAFAADHPNLSGFWEPRSLSVQSKGRPAYTAAARDAMEHAPRRDPHNGTDVADTNCLAMSQPWTLYQSAPIDITQDDRETTMMYEARSLPWHIYTDGRTHPDLAHYRGTLNGHSIGHWEGDAFVVDSVGFSIHDGAKGALMIPNDPTTHVIETFKLAAQGQELHAHFRVEDRQWLSQPYEYDVVWYRDPPNAYAQAQVCDARDAGNAHY